MTDLTAIMRKHRILRISDNSPQQDGSSFSVFLKGDAMGTGKTVGEALDCALRTREAQNTRRAA
jgi:hypothetical protein